MFSKFFNRRPPKEQIYKDLLFCNYQNPFQQVSRGKSGYSRSKEEGAKTKIEDKEEYVNIDLEANNGSKDWKYKDKDIIILSNDVIESNQNTGEKVNTISIQKWSSRIKSFMLFVLILALVWLTMRTIYLEIKLHSNTNQIYGLNREISDLHKLNMEWQTKYAQWSSGHDFLGGTSHGEDSATNYSSPIYTGISP